MVSESGSPDLKAETADSLTLGVVVTPLDNLSVSVDYYSIDIEDGITTISPDIMVERCYNTDPSHLWHLYLGWPTQTDKSRGEVQGKIDKHSER